MADISRDLAVLVLRRVDMHGAFASTVLRHEVDHADRLDRRDVALATEIVYGVLRRRAHVDRALRFASGKRLKDIDPKLHDVLRVGAYQILFLDSVPNHAAVDCAVEQAKGRVGPRRAGAVNAILRKLVDMPPDKRIPPPPPLDPKDPGPHIAAVGSASVAVARVLAESLGVDGAISFLLASLDPAPITLRANLLRCDRDSVASEVGGVPGTLACSVRARGNLGALPVDLACVREGRATPQDEASMRVVELLGARPGERILDVCAAPGGKTTHIAERTNDASEIVAHDRIPERLARVRASAERLHLSSIRTVDVLPSAKDAPFDRVLVDAPCSGLGTLRRHPEIRWRFEMADLEALARTQASVLEEGASRVRVGGALVYSVCTVTAVEGRDRVATLLPDFDLEETLATSPADPGSPDGFFAARLIRRH